jgi:protein-L-isoaspartate O-methyltransferase
VEINGQLVRSLLTLGLSGLHVHHGDFLECNHEIGTFDRILMNPPFANGQDIKHITHALRYLSPGGRLVAICANGLRQNDKLRPIVDARGGIWEELPPDTFIGAGTGVRTVLLTMDA